MGSTTTQEAVNIQHDSVQIHFIVGMPRSGTTWIGNCLGMHKDIAVFGESNFWGRHYVHPNDKNGCYNSSELSKIQSVLHERTWAKTTGDNSEELDYLIEERYRETIKTCFNGLADRQKPMNLFTIICKAIAEDAKKKIVFEKTPHHINFIDRIADLYPESKFIVLIRNPYDFILSMKYMPPYSNNQYYLKRHSLILALHLRKYMKSYSYVVNTKANRVIAFKSDYIWTNTNEAFEQIQDFFGLNGSIPMAHNKSSNSSFTSKVRAELKSSDYFWINLLLKNSIKSSGFKLENKKTSIFEIFFSVIMLPIAMAASLSYLAYIPMNRFKYLLSWFKFK